VAVERPGAETRTFYRIVKTEEPGLQDFTSNRALGRPPRGAELANRQLWEGVSVDTSRRAATNKARKFGLGSFIAELRIPADGPVRFQKTLGSGHYTLWGAPEEIKASVVSILPV
jgi:hypothetical protein